MSKQFLKVKEVSLENGGYLTGKDGNPVHNAEFVTAQRHAEYIVTFAEMAKKKDFVGKKPDSVEDLRRQVMDAVNKDAAVTFVSKPETVKQPTTEKLKSEALDFIKFQENSSKVDKVNAFLQQFKVLNDFEQFGLFFDEENIVKLNKIYSLKEIVASVQEVIDLLD